MMQAFSGMLQPNVNSHITCMSYS